MIKHALPSILTIATLFVVNTSPALAAFSDVPSTNADAQAIAYLQAHAIMKGKPLADGSLRFDPQATLNRAELVTILTRTLQLTAGAGTKNCFSDVGTGSWYFSSVCSAEAMGLISGYPDGTFKPSQAVNKAEALKIIVNGMGLGSDVQMYASYHEGTEWYAPYVTLAREWNLLDSTRTAQSLDAPFTRSDAAELLYRVLITAMARSSGGEIPVFSDALAADYAEKPIAFRGMDEAATFQALFANGVRYENKELGFSLLIPKTMPTYLCTADAPPTIVDVKTVQKGSDVYIGPEWYEDTEYLGTNPNGSGKYGDCKRYTMLEKGDYYARPIKTAIVHSDADISAFIKKNFGETCGPFKRQPSAQNGIEDISITPVPLPGIANPEGLGDFSCITNYVYILKYNPGTHRILGMNLGQDGFFYMPENGEAHVHALDMTMAQTLRMF